MEYAIIAALPGQPPRKGVLTTKHSASSYGRPVVVIDGMAYGTAEISWVDGSNRVRGIATTYGYRVKDRES